MSPQQFTITDGPCRRDLLNAFSNAQTGQSVEFKYYATDARMKFKTGAIIRSLTHESSSGESWSFLARVKMHDGPAMIEGSYNTHSRAGWFKFIA